jgi:hypothetical protein
VRPRRFLDALYERADDIKTISVHHVRPGEGLRVVPSAPLRHLLLRRLFLHLRFCTFAARTIENECLRNPFDVRWRGGSMAGPSH